MTEYQIERRRNTIFAVSVQDPHTISTSVAIYINRRDSNRINTQTISVLLDEDEIDQLVTALLYFKQKNIQQQQNST